MRKLYMKPDMKVVKMESIEMLIRASQVPVVPKTQLDLDEYEDEEDTEDEEFEVG